MRFGIREVCDITFSRVSGTGPSSFEIKSAKMTTLETASTVVYAQGGKGNSRLMAWEGDKTLTFTVEDALISKDSFQALTGATKTGTTTTVFTIKSSSFAGIYRITASTLFRNENGVDYPATISIPKAKLQTTLNLSMAPTGDPSTFTFTFDALADDTGTLFQLSIVQPNDAEDEEDETVVYINGTRLATKNNTPSLTVTNSTTVALSGSTPSSVTLPTGSTGITDFTSIITSGSHSLQKGSCSIWYSIST